MKIPAFILVPGLFAGLSLLADSGSVPAFSSFSLVTERNIFDPDRRPHSRDSAPVNVSPPSRTLPPVLTLTGVLLADNDKTVFLTGSRAGLSGVFRPGDMVSELTIRDVATDKITVETAAGQVVSWAVGASLKHENGNWIPSDASASPAGQAVEAPAGESAAATSGDSAMDILRRLQEKRKKELSK